MPTLTVTSYPNPDLDGTACAIAYAELLEAQGHKAIAYLEGTVHCETAYVLEHFGIALPAKERPLSDQVILVDASWLRALPGRWRPEQVVRIVDHRHMESRDAFPNAEIEIELVGAAATLIAEKFFAAEIVPSPASQALLYAAILSNTLGLQARITTERDRQAAARLNGSLSLPPTFARDMFAAKSDILKGDLAAAMEDELARFKVGTLTIGLCQLELIGGRALAAERQAELLDILARLGSRYELERICLCLVSLDEGVTVFMTYDPATRELLGKALHLSFEGPTAVFPGLILRKETIPLIRKAVGLGG